MRNQRLKFTRTLFTIALTALILFPACDASSGDAELATPSGPPTVDLDAVARHAEQFENEIPIRTAGSPEEEIATSYLLAHMQQAGYLVRLDGVPVKDLVRSTNVVAPPPSGADPETAVIVAYDTGPDGAGDATVLGLWLELARALNVKDPDHTVEFVALGADHAAVEGAPLGQRRLARFLTDEDLDPQIVHIYETGNTAISGFGPDIEAILEEAGPAARPSGSPPADPDPLSDAGFDHTFVTGTVDQVGPALLKFLSQARS
jgi:hypothetical protein